MSLQEQLLMLRQECYFNRGTMPLEEWREYHPKIDVLKKKIKFLEQGVLSNPSIDRIVPAQAEAERKEELN